MTVTEFLLSRISEDEAVANAATQGQWSVDDETYAEYISTNDGSYVVSGGKWGGEASVFDSTEDAIHIARHDPARVLAECAAKRAIITEVSGWGHYYNDSDGWYSCGLAISPWVDDEDNEPGSGCSNEAARGRCTCALEARQLLILKPLAAVYKDHPDYRQEWTHDPG